MSLAEWAQIGGLVSLILVVGGALVAGVVWVIGHRVSAETDARKDKATAELVQTLADQRDAYKLERDELRADVQELERRHQELNSKLAALRDEVGASKAIAELRHDMGKGFAELSKSIEHHEARAQRADQQQAEWNRASTAVLNAIAAQLHISQIIEVPATARTERGG